MCICTLKDAVQGQASNSAVTIGWLRSSKKKTEEARGYFSHVLPPICYKLPVSPKKELVHMSAPQLLQLLLKQRISDSWL